MEAHHLDESFAKELIDKAVEEKIGRKELGLFATGEFFLYRNFDKIVEYAKKKEFFEYIYITTNGVYATEDNIQKIVEAGIDSIRFSINAGTRITYNSLHGADKFDIVINNLINASKIIKNSSYKVNLSVSCVLTKISLHEKEKLKIALEGVVDDIVFFEATNLDKIDDELDRNFGIRQNSNWIDTDNICGYLFNTMFISSNGYVSLCCATNDSIIPIWNLNKDLNLLKAWHSDKMVEYRRLLLYGKAKGTVCEKCDCRTIKNPIRDKNVV
jgi:MoaA/NifB/PqqE/SkfB family radical SAM enzyme